MIEGITKPFELDQPPLSQNELQAAATAYEEGMTEVIRRFGEGMLSLTAIQEPTGEEVGFEIETNAGIVTAIAPNVQLHSYGIDNDNTVRRADSQEIGAVNSQPPEERFSRSWPERRQQTDEENNLGMKNQPVGAEEVRALFALISDASISQDIPPNLEDL